MPTDSDRQTLDVGDLFEALTHPLRRRILTELASRNPRATAQFDPLILATGDEDRQRLAVRLHHVHLPKLAESGLVDWDRGADEVRRGPRFDEIAPLLRIIEESEAELPADWP